LFYINFNRSNHRIVLHRYDLVQRNVTVISFIGISYLTQLIHTYCVVIYCSFSVDYQNTDPTFQFKVNPITGVVQLRNSLDRETTSLYNVSILAIDQGTYQSHNDYEYCFTFCYIYSKYWFWQNIPFPKFVFQRSCCEKDQSMSNEIDVYNNVLLFIYLFFISVFIYLRLRKFIIFLYSM